MALIDEDAATYRARAAWCASDMVRGAQTCPAQMWAYADMNPAKLSAKEARELDDGTAIHLAVCEPGEFEARTQIIDAADYRTKMAQEYREGARFSGRVPLLVHQVNQIMAMRRAVLASPAGLWLEAAKCEQTIIWDWTPWATMQPMPCKGRVDVVSAAPGGPLIDVKSARSASPAAFERALVQYGHHIRAAWYQDGWGTSEGERRRYGYLVVQKEAPYLVNLFWPSPRALEWGRREYRRVLQQIGECQEAGVWRGYEWGREVELPVGAEYRLAEAFAQEDAEEEDA